MVSQALALQLDGSAITGGRSPDAAAASRGGITQPIQRWSVEARAAVPVVFIDLLSCQRQLLLLCIRLEPFDLLRDRLLLRLAVGRNARIRHYRHHRLPPADRYRRY